KFSPAPADNTGLEILAEQAGDILFQAGPDVPGSSEALTALSDALVDYVEGFKPEATPDNVSVQKHTVIEGTYVDGELVEAAPDLDDYFSFKDRMESGPRADDPLPLNAQAGEDGIVVIDQSVQVEMGQNTLVNSAVLTNLWTGSPVMAVLGNHTELNVISQVNAFADMDSVSAMLES